MRFGEQVRYASTLDDYLYAFSLLDNTLWSSTRIKATGELITLHGDVYDYPYLGIINGIKALKKFEIEIVSFLKRRGIVSLGANRLEGDCKARVEGSRERESLFVAVGCGYRRDWRFENLTRIKSLSTYTIESELRQFFR